MQPAILHTNAPDGTREELGDTLQFHIIAL